MDIFDLQAILSLDKSGYDEGLSEAEESASSFGSKLGSAAKGAMAVGTAATAAVSAIGGAVAKSTADVASYGDTIDKQSQKMGISAQAYQEWDQILQHNGASINSLQRGMTTLSKAAEKGDDAFSKLGITQEELASMNKEELFERTIAGLQGMEDGTERTVLAQKLLGGGAKELGPLLNMSAEETEQLRKKTHELGGVMSDEAVKSAAKYQDSLQDMQYAIDGVKRGVVGQFLPAMTGVFDGIAELFSGDKEKGIGMIQDGLNTFIKKLTDIIPEVISTGTKIILSLVKAFTDNLPEIFKAGVQAIIELISGISNALPELIPAAIDAIMTIVETLLDNIDEIIDAGVELIIGLANGLIDALPRIIEKIPIIIEKLVNALVNSAPKIAAAGVQLFVALVKNLPQIIASIVKAVPQIISALVRGFTGGIKSMIQAGKDLLGGLGKGLIEGVKGVVEKAKSAASSVLNAVKGFFGVASPSKEFQKIGGFLMQGLANGITDSLGMVDDAMGALDDMMYAEAPTEDLAVDTSTTTSTFGDGQTFTVPQSQPQRQMTVILQLDRMQLGRAVYNLNNDETQRVGVQLAGGYA